MTLRKSRHRIAETPSDTESVSFARSIVPVVTMHVQDSSDNVVNPTQSVVQVTTHVRRDVHKTAQDMSSRTERVSHVNVSHDVPRIIRKQ